jgi:predicted nucleotidyltransferase
MDSCSSPKVHKDVVARQPQIVEACARLAVRRLDLFGSAARGHVPRDLDFLVDLGDRPPADYAQAYFALYDRLAELFSCPVDLITPAGLQNPYFRQRVDKEKILLYAA